MEEKYRNYFIRELKEPEQQICWFWAGSLIPDDPSFKSEWWDTGLEPSKMAEERSLCLKRLKEEIDRYYKEKNEWTIHEGKMTVEIPFRRKAKTIDEAIRLEKEYIEERLIAAVKVLDYKEKKND